MLTADSYPRTAGPRTGVQARLKAAAIAALLAVTGLTGCAQPTPPGPAAAAAAPAVTPLPFDDAVLSAANAVFSAAPHGTGRQVVVIDPLVDGMTGEQSRATQSIQDRIAALVRARYPQFDIEPFTTDTVGAAPLVLVGTFTPVNAQGQTSGERQAFRFCLVMADLKSGKTVAKGVARARLDGVDSTPTPFFRDSPGWSDDANVKGYINTCQATKVGDPISPVYLNGIVTASAISEAIKAYDSGHYQEALELYSSARQTPAGRQLRVLNGLYLTKWKLGRRGEATDSFGDLVDYGLDNNRLAVKLLFRPGSTAFVANPQLSAAYPMWLQQIASHSAQRNACLAVIGNTSRTGSAVLNDRLSTLRAEYVKSRLEQAAPGLRNRVIASGVGSKESLTGTGANDATDVLDRRVDFKPIPRC